MGICPNAPSMNPSDTESAKPPNKPGIIEKKMTWIPARNIKTDRGPNRSKTNPTINCANEAAANTRKAIIPIVVANLSAAIKSCKRSSKIFGNANVVD